MSYQQSYYCYKTNLSVLTINLSVNTIVVGYEAIYILLLTEYSVNDPTYIVDNHSMYRGFNITIIKIKRSQLVCQLFFKFSCWSNSRYTDYEKKVWK